MHDDDNELYELDKPVPYVPTSPEESAARSMKLLGEQYGYTAPAAPFRNTAPAVTVVAVPPGAGGARLLRQGLQLRHRSATPVLVRSTRLTNGGHVTTLPADGFPGATWEVFTPAPPAPHPYVLGAPVPATGPAERCTRCGGPLDKHAVELPVGIGSRSATHPATLCHGCYEQFQDMTVEWTLGPARLAATPAAPAKPGPLAAIKEQAAGDGDYCRHCDVFVGFGGAGVAREPEGMSQEWKASHCWVCNRSAHELQAEAAGKCPNCLATLERCDAGGCGQRQSPGWRTRGEHVQAVTP